MKLSAFKNQLEKISEINFIQPNGSFIPKHFHITEAGLLTKHFIDCGGTLRTEKQITFQLWIADDFDHRLQPQKLKNIIELAEPLFGQGDLEIEIEFQNETIGRYGVAVSEDNFLLINKQTNCLALDKCGFPQEKQKIRLSDINISNNTCTPGSGCC
jgi:hypothetical protein